MQKKRVIDLSGWNAVTSYPAVKAAGVDEAILKVIGKTLSADKRFKEHYYGCTRAGIKVIGGYTYCYANTTAKAKTAAAAYVRTCKGMVDKLWLDLEDKVMMGLGSRIVDIIKIYQTAAQSAGMGFGIYTGTSFYTSYIKPYIKQLAGIEFWFARYPRTKTYGVLETAPGEPGKYLPAGVPIAGWQFTSCGQVPGINGRVDLSDWYYTESQTSTADIPVDKCPHKEPTITIKLGSTGEGANWVLWYLWRFGMMLDANGKPDGARINGYIGQADETAIKQAQTVLGLKADGKVGSATRAAFKKVL